MTYPSLSATTSRSTGRSCSRWQKCTLSPASGQRRSRGPESPYERLPIYPWRAWRDVAAMRFHTNSSPATHQWNGLTPASPPSPQEYGKPLSGSGTPESECSRGGQGQQRPEHSILSVERSSYQCRICLRWREPYGGSLQPSRSAAYDLNSTIRAPIWGFSILANY